jgi:hypothetical protein
MIIFVLTEIRIDHFPNGSQKLYPLSQRTQLVRFYELNNHYQLGM